MKRIVGIIIGVTGALFTLGLLLLVALIGISSLAGLQAENEDARAFQQRALTLKAEVVDAWQETSPVMTGMVTQNLIHLTYTTAGQTFDHTLNVSDEIFAGAQRGSSLEVLVDPDNPVEFRLPARAAHQASSLAANWGIFLGLLAGSGVTLLAFLTLLIRSLRSAPALEPAHSSD